MQASRSPLHAQNAIHLVELRTEEAHIDDRATARVDPTKRRDKIVPLVGEPQIAGTLEKDGCSGRGEWLERGPVEVRAHPASASMPRDLPRAETARAGPLGRGRSQGAPDLRAGRRERKGVPYRAHGFHITKRDPLRHAKEQLGRQRLHFFFVHPGASRRLHDAPRQHPPQKKREARPPIKNTATGRAEEGADGPLRSRRRDRVFRRGLLDVSAPSGGIRRRAAGMITSRPRACSSHPEGLRACVGNCGLRAD